MKKVEIKVKGKKVTGYGCTTEDMHPYECDQKGKCIHCDRRETNKHNPANCALCNY